MILTSCRALLIVVALVPGCSGSNHRPIANAAAKRSVTTAEVELPVPEGYEDITANMQKEIPEVAVALSAKPEAGRAVGTVIVLQKAPLPTGAIDEAACAERAKTVVFGAPAPAGSQAKLRGTKVVTWFAGRACEIEFISPEGGATIATELYDRDTTGEPSRDSWLLICQYDDGDDRAVAVCRSTRAALVLRNRARH